MVFDSDSPYVFRERRVVPADAGSIAAGLVRDAERALYRGDGLLAYAVHRSIDRRRVVAIEAWRDPDACRRARSDASGDGRYVRVGPARLSTTDDRQAGAIVIDLFGVWRPLVRPVAAFNVRNGRAFDRDPQCLGTTVLRSVDAGSIATYARWTSSEAFAAAFSRITGRPAATTDDVNRIAARMTLGLVRPDYRVHELVAAKAATA